MSKIIPNTFMCFNTYVDRAMYQLSDSELRVLLFATRHILGWQDKIDSRRGRISISMFVEGFESTDEDGVVTVYKGCGLGEAAVRTACNSLHKLGFLKKIGEPTLKGQQWQLGESPNWTALEVRTSDQAAKRKHQVEKASAAATVKRLGVSLNDTQVTSDDTLTSDDTQGVSLNDRSWVSFNEVQQSHIQSHDQNQVKAAAIEPPPLPQIPTVKNSLVVQPQPIQSAVAVAPILVPPPLPPNDEPLPEPAPIYAFYVENMRQQVNGIIKDKLVDWVKDVGEQWVRDAIVEAVTHNVPTWAYAEACLESWVKFGRDKPRPSSVRGAGLKPALVAPAPVVASTSLGAPTLRGK